MEMAWLRRLWMLWEALFRKVAGVRPLRKDGGEYMFLLATRPYVGKPFLVDGVPVNKHDLVAELHMNNEMILQVFSEGHGMLALSKRLLDAGRQSLPVLAERMQDSEFEGVEVLYGISFVHRVAEAFGFHTFPMSNPFIRAITTWYLRVLFRVINPNGGIFIKRHPDMFIPRVIAISKQHLIERYGR